MMAHVSVISHVFDLIELMVTDGNEVTQITEDGGDSNNKSLSNVLNLRFEKTLILLKSANSSYQQILNSHPPESEISFLSQDTETDNVTHWEFVKCALYLIETLRWGFVDCPILTTTGVEQSQQSQPPPTTTTKLLSVHQQKLLSQLIEYIIALGVCPYLEPGVGVPLTLRAHFSPIAISQMDTLFCVHQQTPQTEADKYHRLLICIKYVLKLRSVNSIWTQVVGKYLSDVLVTLLQISFSDVNKRYISSEDRQFCYSCLKNVVNSTYTPLLVEELLVLQGGFKTSGTGVCEEGMGRQPTPVWLTRACGRLLSGCLIRPNGVSLVVRAILDALGKVDRTGCSVDWRTYEMIASVISTPSKLATTCEAYYQTVLPQILDLLIADDDPFIGKHLMNIARLTISRLIIKMPIVSEKFIIPQLLSPLLNICSLDASSDIQHSFNVLPTEQTLSTCIGNIFKVYVAGPSPYEGSTSALVLPVTNPIFKIYIFTLNGVSLLKTQCEQILLKLLVEEGDEGVSTLYKLSLDQPVNNNIFNPRCVLHYGEEGGVKVTYKTELKSNSDIVEELYNNLEHQDNCCEAISSLLTCCKSSNLPGQFMLLLLKELPSMLNLTDTQTRFGVQTKLVIFGLLSRLCDRFGPSVLQNYSQMLQFLNTTMQRLSDLSSENSVANNDADTDELNEISCETFTLVAGFLSVLSPTEYSQLTDENKIIVKNMVPLIRKFSRNCDNSVVRSMAEGLCVSISTHWTIPTDKIHNTDSCNAVSHNTDSDCATSINEKLICDCCCKDRTCCVYLSALVEAYDSLLPVRAHGLRILAELIHNKNSCAMNKKDNLLSLFMRSVDDDDQFLYLAAAQGLSTLAQTYPDTIFTFLIKQLSQFQDKPTTNKEPRTVKVRLILAEALMKAIRGLGDLLVHHSDKIIGVLLIGVRDIDTTIRASSLSNLAEVCKLLNHKLDTFISELLNCLHCVLQTDKSVEVRRGAVFVLRQIFQGLGDKTVLVLDCNMRDIYRLLKQVRDCDTDDVCKLHAQLTLENLDHIMRQHLFPKQSLAKNISILPPTMSSSKK